MNGAHVDSRDPDPLTAETAVPLEVLQAEICQRAANMTAAELEWLLLVAQFDERRGWDYDGAVSCAHWLSNQVGLDMRAAREKVRVARALRAYDHIATAMATGLLSYAKVRAITRVVNADTQEYLVDMAASSTSNQVERIVAAMRRRDAISERLDDHAWRWRGVWFRERDGMTEITIRLPVEAGKVLHAAIEVFMSTDTTDTVAQRRADAVIAMAEHAVAHRDDPPGSEPRYLACIHVDDSALDPDADGQCSASAADGHSNDTAHGICLHTMRRILSASVREGLLEDDDGNITKTGPRRRTPGRRLRRHILRRDNGCRFPGCDRAGWLDIHHIQHVLDHGQTVEDNLVCLCRYHHRLMHEGHWNITGDPRRRNGLTFHRPNGTTLDPHPPHFPGSAHAVDTYSTITRTRPPTENSPGSATNNRAS